MEPKPRHLFSPSHACPNPECRETAAECERKTEIIRQLQVELNKSMENEAAANAVAKAAGRAAVAAKGENTRKANDKERRPKIEQVRDFWLETHPRSRVPVGETRWQTIDKAIRLMTPDEDEENPVDPVSACLEALTGARLAPFEQYGKWHATPGKGRKRRDDITDVLRNEVRIEMFREIYRRARMSTEQKVYEGKVVTGRVAEAWHQLWVEIFTGYEGTA